MYRFYNGYNKIEERLHYSKPGVAREENLDGIWLMRAPEQGYFEAPEMIRLDNNSAAFTDFERVICSQFHHFGVVLIDPEKDPARFPWPVAKNDKEAKVKGDEINHEYLLDVVQKYVSNVEELRAAGRTPMPAQGYVKHALKRIGMQDPALEVKNFVEKAAQKDEVAELKAQMAALMERLGEKAVANAR